MKVTILGVAIDRVTESQAINWIEQFLGQARTRYIVTANPEMLVAATKDSDFKLAINNADLVVPDGIGLLAMADFLSNVPVKIYSPLKLALQMLLSLARVLFAPHTFTVLPERVSGADLFLTLCRYAMEHAHPVVLVGGTEAERDGTVAFLNQQYPSLTIITDEGAGNANLETEEEFSRLAEKLLKLPRYILFVAYGHPKQELWMSRHISHLPPGVLIGVGGTFSYYSHEKPRAPKFLQSIGLEWLWRLVMEPARFNRIITATIRFPYLVFQSQR